MKSEAEVASLFSFDESELEKFPHLRAYMNRIRSSLPEILRHPDIRRRFMLAGLFATYRRSTRSGQAMSTQPSEIDDLPELDRRRLETFHRETGLEIQDESHYLKLIAMSPFKVLFKGPGRHLYHFVIEGA